MSAHSTTPMWNCLGRQKNAHMAVTACAKNIDGCVNCSGICRSAVSIGTGLSSVVSANNATTASASSLNTDSAAMATTMPG
jgi:hypothetical protein